MTKRTRNITIIACAAASIASLTAYGATGMYPYTRFKSDETAAINSETSLAAMFDDTGFDDGDGQIQQIDNVNAIGLLPSGAGLASLSVATVTGPALVIAAGALFLTRRRSSAA